jgi:hypothetical protein
VKKTDFVPTLPAPGGKTLALEVFSETAREKEKKKKKEKPEKGIYRLFDITIPDEHLLEEIGIKSHELLDWRWDDERKALFLDVMKDDKKYTLEISGETLARKLGYKGEVVDVDWEVKFKRELPFVYRLFYFTIREKAENKLGKVL